MHAQPNDFKQSAVIALEDIQLKTAITRATGNANKGRADAMNELEHPEALRQQGRAARLRGLHDLPELLEQVEQKVTAAGGKVLWALDGDEANRHMLNICREHNVKRGVKAKSMVTEEIHLVPFLEQHGIEMVETDLGEYIVQVSKDRPSHIIMPVMHLTKEAVRERLMANAGMPYAETPEEMTAFARQKLRHEYLQADLGISGGNFIIAETGHVVTVTNEGNARLSTGIPRVHVAFVGIEKVIPTWEDFVTLMQLLTRHGTGQRLTVYINMMLGPGRDEGDGSEHFYLILLDNGRSDIFASEYAESLACIRCGSCLNVCPVYQSVGGHAYGAVYPGPIGAVITPLLQGKENAVPLPFASSLCGACKTACPVDINIPDMLLMLRRDLEKEQEPVWRAGMKGFAFGMGHPLLYRAGGKAAAEASKQIAARKGDDNQPVLQELPFPFNGWTDKRDFPAFAEQSFREWWGQNRKK
ncbi:MAG: lactate utilization protein B [Anaerolineae bacterium]